MCVYKGPSGKTESCRRGHQRLADKLDGSLQTIIQSRLPQMVNLRVNMRSTKQIDWQPDGSDLMQEAEGYYQELKAQRLWSKKGAPSTMYINEALEHGQEENSVVTELMDSTDNEHHLPKATVFGQDITALTLKLKKFNKNVHKKIVDQKYKWKYTPPKSGES